LSLLPQIPSPPLPLLSPPPTDPTYKEAPLGYRATKLQWRAERDEIFEADLPLQKRLCTIHTDIVKRGEGSTYAAMQIGYGITNTWDDLVGAIQESAPTTVEGVTQRVTELSTTFDRETSTIYAMIEERQDDQALQRARVNSDAALSGVIALRTQKEIRELQAGHRKLHAQFIQALTALKSCQTQLTAALGRIQKTTRVPALPEVPEEASSTRDADRNTNDDDSHNSRTGARRTGRVTRECTYPDSMKCKPLHFKGT
nr:hypothetical protein [Tanacetum cinerariifolium]